MMALILINFPAEKMIFAFRSKNKNYEISNREEKIINIFSFLKFPICIFKVKIKRIGIFC